MSAQPQTVDLLGLPLARLDSAQLLDHLFGGLASGRGGWVITANLDFLRRFCRDPAMRELYGRADVVVADGMPLVWASRLQGDVLLERVAGSSVCWDIAERAAAEGRSLYLLGGDPGAAGAAGAVLTQRFPGLTICGHGSPMFASPPTVDQLAPVREALRRTKPDVLLVGLGSPKQEQLIEALRHEFPGTWMIGVGISFSFIAGMVQRAPEWMQRSGLEWVHRLAQEPRRLARRYLVDDIPFAAELFTRAVGTRLRRRLARR